MGGGTAGFKLDHSRVSWGFWEKEKKIRPGGAYTTKTRKREKRRFRHLYIGEYGKITKISYFWQFSP